MNTKEFKEKIETKYGRYVLLTEWNKYFDYPKIGTLRSLVFHSHKNGFNNVVRRIGSRIVINVDAYFEWLEEYGKQ
mgnify:FL=1